MLIRSRLIIIFALIGIGMCLMTSCNKDDIKETKQLVVQDVMKATHIVPDNGIDRLEAITLVSNYLRDEVDIEGDFSDCIEFIEVTTQELWDNSSIQLFQVRIPYAWFDGLVIFEEGELIGLLSGMHTIEILISDLDMNGSYDICLNTNYGSGIVNSYIQVFNTSNKKAYMLNMREQEKDIIIEVNENMNCVDVYYRDLFSYMDARVYGGCLSIRDNAIEVIEFK